MARGEAKPYPEAKEGMREIGGVGECAAEERTVVLIKYSLY